MGAHDVRVRMAISGLFEGKAPQKEDHYALFVPFKYSSVSIHKWPLFSTRPLNTHLGAGSQFRNFCLVFLDGP